jgi:hypothetical protein
MALTNELFARANEADSRHNGLKVATNESEAVTDGTEWLTIDAELPKYGAYLLLFEGACCPVVRLVAEGLTRRLFKRV